ncbi:iron complex transport system ATP-binding protein [Archangium gephyra]|uniref:Iron complex transport system ATP-binding protein n=1 Tax=Archangium gephyra TaxID=48 RepID=A0AAC8QHU2_9BACT|nr:ABC transporter ATP-binding protein [Archangium gephyra]AKJ07614.1 Vitamin B12 ABC transporter, ATPase component BtuD [Archangium gephyra]REG29370.1 iron complex transport system ATP-binding protein [Archangium gephyra]
MDTLLDIQGLSAGYGPAPVLRDVDCAVRAGELWVVLGPNGTGKSTLLKSVLGAMPWTRGRIHLLARERGEWEARALARNVAWVPQGFEPAEGFSGLELVLMGRSPHLGLWGLTSASDEAVAREVLEELGVAYLAERSCEAMSGGERRMLLLARALVQQPKLLLLDEPTAFLDVAHQVGALERVRARVDAGLGAVAVLHDVNLAAAFATHVLLLRDGHVLARGPAPEVLQRERLEALYGVPMEMASAPSGARLFAPRTRWTAEGR